MSGKKEAPVQRTNGKVPTGCAKCKAGFAPEGWPRSKWTSNGYSPWCPQCHADLAHDSGVLRIKAKPGPKPKLRGVAAKRGGWTNMPIN